MGPTAGLQHHPSENSTKKGAAHISHEHLGWSPVPDQESSSFAASGWSVEISAAAASSAFPSTHSSGERNGFLLIEPESEADYGHGTDQDPVQSER